MYTRNYCLKYSRVATYKNKMTNLRLLLDITRGQWMKTELTSNAIHITSAGIRAVTTVTDVNRRHTEQRFGEY